MTGGGKCDKQRRCQAARAFCTWSVVVALLLACPSSPLFGQYPLRLPPVARIANMPVGPRDSSTDDLAAKLRQRGDLTLSDTTLRQALFAISESWQINLVVGDEVSGQVNGVFKNAPLHEILNSILYANGYGYQVVGQGLVVMKADTLGDSNPLFTTEAIVLRSVKPEDVIEGASLLRSPQGKIKAIPSARSLMVVDFPERIAVIRQFVEEVDRSAGTIVGDTTAGLQRKVAQFTPQYVKVITMKESLDSVLSKDGKAIVIEPENRIIVVDYPMNLEMASRVVQELDQARPQVRITAMIYDVSLEDLERLGINWRHAIKGNSLTTQGTPDAMWAIDSLTTVPASAGTPAAAMTFMNLSRNFDITATINALCESKDAQLLADPSVTVVDREPATIQIVTEIPYQQLTQTQQGGQIGTTAFREAGVTLMVTPHIANDGTVQMEVTPTFSRLTGFTNGQNPQPIIDKRQAQTTVRVQDQQWLVIGGLRQRTAVKNDRGVPKLDQIKYINKLFTSYDHNFRESELIVFLRPESVTPTYGGREREQQTLGASHTWLDETPVAPEVLAQGEVGCANCGKSSCDRCCLRRKNQPDTECAVPAREELPPPDAIDPLGHQLPGNIRRLPSVANNDPMRTSARRTALPPSTAPHPTAPPRSSANDATPSPGNNASGKTAHTSKATPGKPTTNETTANKPAKAAKSSSGGWFQWW